MGMRLSDVSRLTVLHLPEKTSYFFLLGQVEDDTVRNKDLFLRQPAHCQEPHRDLGRNIPGTKRPRQSNIDEADGDQHQPAQTRFRQCHPTCNSRPATKLLVTWHVKE